MIWCWHSALVEIRNWWMMYSRSGIRHPWVVGLLRVEIFDFPNIYERFFVLCRSLPGFPGFSPTRSARILRWFMLPTPCFVVLTFGGPADRPQNLWSPWFRLYRRKLHRYVWSCDYQSDFWKGDCCGVHAHSLCNVPRIDIRWLTWVFKGAK